MTTNRADQRITQEFFQQRVVQSAPLARHDGVSVGASSNFVVYTVPDRTRAVIRWYSFTNRASSSTPTYVSFFVTATTGASPRIFRYLFDVEAQAYVVSGGDELVLNAGDALECLAETNTVTADIYVSGAVEILPS